MAFKSMEEYLKQEIEAYHKSTGTKDSVEVEYIHEIRIYALLRAVDDLLKRKN